MEPSATSYSLLTRRPAVMTPFVLVSIGLHAAVILVAVAWGMFARPAAVNLDQKPIKASLVRLGKPRDEKLLPRKEELPAPPKKIDGPEPTPAAKVPEKPVETIPIPGVKPPPQQAAAKQAGEKNGQDRRSALFNAFGKVNSKAEELEGAADGDPNGDSATQEGERYFGAITSVVHRYYDVSQTISEQERMHLKAEVVVRIDKRGKLMEARLAKNSGNELFDSAVVSAVKKAAPFAPPPDHLSAMLEKGIILSFSP